MTKAKTERVIPECDRPEQEKGQCRGCENSYAPELYDGGCKLPRGRASNN